jgi:hypothetical protein
MRHSNDGKTLRRRSRKARQSIGLIMRPHAVARHAIAVRALRRGAISEAIAYCPMAAEDVGIDGGTAWAEEAAVHIVEP